MVKLKELKHETEGLPIETMPLPSKVFIPLIQHLGKPSEPAVNVGDTVVTGQVIGKAAAHVCALIHASISGKVTGIADYPHPVLGRAKAIVIERGPEETKSFLSQPRDDSEILSLAIEKIREGVFNAGVVGLGGASFPTHIKLAPLKPARELIINGAECEPYLTSDYRLMIERSKEVIKGIELVRRCIGAEDVYIAIEDNKPEAIRVFKEECKNKGYVLKVLKSFYPQGGEKQLIKNILKKEVPSGKLPFDIGVVVHNVATVFAVYEAIYLDKPLYERVLTVTGSCIKNPRNLLVRIGTHISDIINYCGIKNNPKKIITGGPMMGIAQYIQEVPVIKSTNGIICLQENELTFSLNDSFCIRCGRCVEYCPVNLMPSLINMASLKERWDLAKRYGCLDCIECGVCSYACPQRINLVQTIKKAKLKVPR